MLHKQALRAVAAAVVQWLVRGVVEAASTGGVAAAQVVKPMTWMLRWFSKALALLLPSHPSFTTQAARMKSTDHTQAVCLQATVR